MTTTTRLGITLIAPTQSNKATTANDATQALEDATMGTLAISVASASDTLTDAEFLGAWLFAISGAATAGRTVTLPSDIERVFAASLDDASTESVDIVVGSNSVTVDPGMGAVLRTDGAGDVAAIMRGTMGGGVAYGSISGRKVKLGCGFEAALGASEVFFRWVADESVTIPASLSGSVFDCETPDAGAATVLTIAKNGISAGTITIGTGGAITVSFASPLSMASGDVLTVAGPATETAAEQFAGTIIATAA